MTDFEDALCFRKATLNGPFSHRKAGTTQFSVGNR